MEMFSQDSSKSRALKARMDELKAQLEKTQKEYDRVRQEEFKEAVRRFLDEFNIRTIEDLNNAAMKLRGMKPEIVKEAARNIRAQETVSEMPHKDDIGVRKSYYRPSREPSYASRKVASESLEKLAETTKSLFTEKTARKEEPAREESPVEEKTEIFFDDTEEAAEDAKVSEQPERDAEPGHEDGAESETPADDHADPGLIPEMIDDAVDPSVEETAEPVTDEKSEAGPDTFAKTDSFDLGDDDIDMNWDFGDDDDDNSKEIEPADAEPAPAKAEDEMAEPMTEADIDTLSDELGKIELSDEQVAALRNKVVVVRAANKLTHALFKAEQELDPSMLAKDVSALFDYDPAVMRGTSIREKYQEADKMIAALDGNITEQNTPEAYPVYAEFKDFPDFIRNRAMTLVAMEIEEYFA